MKMVLKGTSHIQLDKLNIKISIPVDPIKQKQSKKRDRKSIRTWKSAQDDQET